MKKYEITPTRTIRLNCYIFCMNLRLGRPLNCQNEKCLLKNRGISTLKRIKAFCAECAPDFKPKDCKGVILNTKETRDFGKCPL